MIKNKKISICYFSGTGNTETVAGLFQNDFKLNDCHVDLIKIDDILKNKKKLEIEKYDMIGFAHPVFGLDTPGIFYRFIRKLPRVNNLKSFLFKTAADFISVNYGASKRVIRKLRNKGYNIFHESLIVMPSNWLVKYEDDFNKQLYLTSIKKSRKIVNEILSDKKIIIKAGVFIRILALVTNYFEENWAGRFFGKTLHVNDSCSDCGKCIRECPVENIYERNNKIKFKYRCIFCMKCVYACPQNAITSRFMGFCIHKDGYNIKKIINNPDLKGNFVTKKTTGFYKHFYRYFFSD